ncbi:siroheme synthase CysG [Acuticoccus sp. M5D2P5]|uniref:siroheme synthase CysG n=1 Tax=Acuticoccus kalidii TaxID=2910977 RepID=UPI001F2963F3|nr:siroheme synthase CysG [Acuticoccus kalidii]
MKTFPIFWSVEGRTALLFGGGSDAAAKLRLLQKTTAKIVVVARAFEPDVIDLSDVEAIAADPLTVALPENVALAYAATGDAALDAAIAYRMRAANIPVCAADQPEVSDFITPAIVDRDPVVVAIGTEGTAPVLAREIKARVERLLPTHLGAVAKKANALREHVARTLAPGAPRRRFWHGLFGPALDGAFERESFGRAARRLLDVGATKPDGAVSFVGAGAGGADLLTERARLRIDRADVVLYDALVAPEILELARREAIMVNVGKRAGRHALSQDEINALIVAHARDGARVVRLKGGDPSIFGRLAEEIDAVQAAGLPAEIVPGVTAASVAAASSLSPLTERGRAQELRIITAHGADGEEDIESVDWAAAAGNAPLAVYMGRRTAPRVAARLVREGRAADTPVVLVENAGRSDERIAHSALSDLAATVARFGGSGPLMILIGVNSRQLALAAPAELQKEAA